MRKQTTCYICDKPIEPERIPEGKFIVCDECSTDTDKLSAEKLQEQLNTAKKALTEIAFPKKAIWQEGSFVALEATEDAKIAHEALAEIGGYDEL